MATAHIRAILDSVAVRDGVARVASLQRAGHSRHGIRRALETGELARVRRDWVALPAADPFLIAAAREAVVLTCVTAAQRKGLWVMYEGKPHVAAGPNGAKGKPPTVHVHWAAPLVPRHPDDLVDGFENTLALIAVCQPYEHALAVWESALRQKLVDRRVLESMQLSTAARRILAEATPFSDSGLESFVPPRLRFLGERIVPQAWVEDRPVDFLIGERLVLQIDGGHHVGRQRTRDIEHDARLMLLGYHVVRVGYQQVVEDWPAVQAQIMRAVAQGLHRER